MHTLPVLRVTKKKKRSLHSAQIRSQSMKASIKKTMGPTRATTKMPEIKCSAPNWTIGDCCHEVGEQQFNTPTSGHLILPEIPSPQKRRTPSSDSVIGISKGNYRRKSKKTDELDTCIGTPSEEKKIEVLNGRIKDFITKENPGRPPITLRYAPLKQPTDETAVFLKPKASSLPINTESCPNLYLLADREKWSYNYKPGKCRYLRCPQSPVLQPDEIFATD